MWYDHGWGKEPNMLNCYDLNINKINKEDIMSEP